MAIIRLIDICEKIGSGATPRGGKESYCDEGISLVRSQNVLDFVFSCDGLAHINDDQAKRLDNVEVQANDVLLNITGDSVARACMMESAYLPARVNQHVAIIRGKTNYVIPSYILYFLQWKKEYLLQLASAGATRNALTKGMIEKLEIDLPSLDEQERIVAILNSLQDKIRINQKINDNLQQQAISIFKEWFLENYEATKWPLVTLGSITSLICRGITPKYAEDSGQVVINQKCIRDRSIDIRLARSHIPKAITEKWLQYGDLLINSTGEGTLGRAAQVWFTPENITVDSHVTIVRPQTQLLIFYVGFWGITHEREIEALHTGSTGQTELPRDRVRAMELCLPDDGLLAKFNAIVQPMVSTVVANQKENVKLEGIRDALLPKLMSGEIDVSSVEV